MPPEDRKLPRQKIITDESHDTILTSYQPIYGHVSPTSMTKHALEGQTRVPEAYKSMHQEDQKSLNITPNMLPHYPTLTPRVHAYVTCIISNIHLHVRSNQTKNKPPEARNQLRKAGKLAAFEAPPDTQTWSTTCTNMHTNTALHHLNTYPENRY